MFVDNPSMWRQTYDDSWQPTFEDYVELCGVWIGPAGQKTKVIPRRKYTSPNTFVALDDFPSADLFRDLFSQFEKIEPIPLQCIPGYKEQERKTPEWMREAVERCPHQED
jgi:hypothetical protein